MSRAVLVFKKLNTAKISVIWKRKLCSNNFLICIFHNTYIQCLRHICTTLSNIKCSHYLMSCINDPLRSRLPSSNVLWSEPTDPEQTASLMSMIIWLIARDEMVWHDFFFNKMIMVIGIRAELLKCADNVQKVAIHSEII